MRIDATLPLDKAQLWLRIDRPGGRPGFFDNMADRPIRAKAWNDYEIAGEVARDAERIVLGILVVGAAPAWLDDVSLKIEGNTPASAAAPPRALSDRGSENLVAFARLLGYVRHFHPSDQAALADWDRLAVDGVRAVESSQSPQELAQRLQDFFRPVAPTVRVFATDVKPATPEELTAPPKGEDARVVFWEHFGYGPAPPAEGVFSVYRSQRIRARLADGKPPAGRPEPARPYFANLGGGVSCLVPLAVYANESGTIPELKPPAKREGERQAFGRRPRHAAGGRDPGLEHPSAFLSLFRRRPG